VISIKGLSKAFNGNQVLKEVNLELRKAENLVVLGKSGSGKSTIIKCLVRLIEPDGGRISAFGKDMTEVEYDELNSIRTKIGFLFQGNALYDSMTVYENLAFPLRHHYKDIDIEKLDSEIKEVLESVGLPDAGGLMPSELSGGMSKRIGLARTMILKPEVMLYDEPTTGLDTITAREISHLMLDLKNKYHISSLIITHDIPVTKAIADRIVILKEGTIVAEGTYEELAKKDDEWIKSFFS
jgi:phospholipid/cholesterol/gamma-HCH transport system ATP-binding protein